MPRTSAAQVSGDRTGAGVVEQEGPEAPEALPVRVEVLGPASCPSANTFVAKLNEHVPTRQAGADEPAHALVVVVANRESGVVGRLESASTSGVAGHEVAAATCSEVFEALALSAALALEGKPPPEPPEAPAEADEPKTAPPTSAQSERPVDDGEAPGASHQVSRWDLSLGGRIWGASVPALVGAELGVNFNPGHWQVGARLMAGFQVGEGSTAVDLNLAGFGLDGCWLGVSTPALSFGPCLNTDVHAMIGAGDQVRDARTVVLAYGATGLRARLRVWLGGSWFLAADAGAEAVWLAPEFLATDPDRVVEKVEPLTVTGGIGFGTGF